MKKYIFGMILVLMTSNAFACEKWKGEIVKLAWESGKYFKLYKSFKDEKMDKLLFLSKTQIIISEINELSDYVGSTDSCPGSKFQARKLRLVNYMGKALLIMKGGQFIKAFNKRG